MFEQQKAEQDDLSRVVFQMQPCPAPPSNLAGDWRRPLALHSANTFSYKVMKFACCRSRASNGGPRRCVDVAARSSLGGVARVHHVVHLAGANVGQRWTPAHKPTFSRAAPRARHCWPMPWLKRLFWHIHPSVGHRTVRRMRTCRRIHPQGRRVSLGRDSSLGVLGQGLVARGRPTRDHAHWAGAL